MDFYAEILAKLLRDEGGAGETLRGLAETRCCRALEEIRDVLKDDTLSDPECFQRIERIVCVLEDLGPGGGGRHDFG